MNANALALWSNGGLGRRVVAPVDRVALELLEARYLFSGQIDAGFGDRGQAFGPAAFAPGPISRQVIAMQADGGIVVGGDGGEYSTGSTVLRRFLPDGSIDLGFRAPLLSNHYVPTLLAQPDGKLLLVDDDSFVRLNADGSLDPTYSFAPPPSVRDFPYFYFVDAETAADGSTVAIYSGWFGGGAVARFRPDGTPDPTFGDGGEVYFAEDHVAWYLAAAPDGGVLVVMAGNDTTSLLKLDRHGAVDSAFGGGLVKLADEGPLGATQALLGRTVLAQADGGAIVGLHDFEYTADWDVVEHTYLVRVTGGGVIDMNFGGGDGRADLPVGIELLGMLGRADGKIIVNGILSAPASPDRAMALIRLTADGRPDETFGPGGVVTPPGVYAQAAWQTYQENYPNVALQGDDVIVLVNDHAAGQAPGRFFHLFRVTDQADSEEGGVDGAPPMAGMAPLADDALVEDEGGVGAVFDDREDEGMFGASAGRDVWA